MNRLQEALNQMIEISIQKSTLDKMNGNESKNQQKAIEQTKVIKVIIQEEVTQEKKRDALLIPKNNKKKLISKNKGLDDIKIKQERVRKAILIQKNVIKKEYNKILDKDLAMNSSNPGAVNEVSGAT